ncbi:MAG: sulfatase [Gemmataceae bacterium]
MRAGWWLAWVAVGALGFAPRLTGAPPNIIHILADDVGYDDFGCFGCKDIATPNVDALAARGTRFTSFYAPHPTCTASRAALLTGCYAVRVGLPPVLFPDSKIGLNADEVTIAELLKAKGYATACVGKWHLGHQSKFLPTHHGFDRFLGIPYPNDHVPERLDKNGKTRGFPPMPLIRDLRVVEQPAQMAALPERFTKEAEAFIAENKNRPFFLHLANVETHTPWLVPRPYQYTSKAGVYGDAVRCFDATVGRVVAAVEKAGLTANTLIVVTSDNGPLVHEYPELEGIYGHAAAVDTARRHVLREGKYQARYEGGSRVACVVAWPGTVPAGRTCDEVVAGFDLFTTFAKLAGADVPADRVIDGKDVTPLLKGEPGAKSPHAAFYSYQGPNLMAVRVGNWKLVFPAGGPKKAGKPELYDLAANLGETTNLYASQPDVVKRLEAVAEAARTDLGDARTGRKGKNLRPAGTAE